MRQELCYLPLCEFPAQYLERLKSKYPLDKHTSNYRKTQGRGVSDWEDGKQSVEKGPMLRSLILGTYIKQVEMCFWNPRVSLGQLVYHRDGI